MSSQREDLFGDEENDVADASYAPLVKIAPNKLLADFLRSISYDRAFLKSIFDSMALNRRDKKNMVRQPDPLCAEFPFLTLPSPLTSLPAPFCSLQDGRNHY